MLLCEDTRVTKKLISLLVERNLLKTKEYQYLSFHTHNEKEFLSNVSLEFFSKNIGFLSDAGMPCISDPGVSFAAVFLRRGGERGWNFVPLPAEAAAIVYILVRSIRGF